MLLLFCFMIYKEIIDKAKMICNPAVDSYYFFKNSKLKYRVSLDDSCSKFLRFFSSSSKIKRIFYYI